MSEPILLTRARAVESRKRRESGVIYPLRTTGGAARVRFPSLSDPAVILAVPTHLQRVLALLIGQHNLQIRSANAAKMAAMTDEERYQEYARLNDEQDQFARWLMATYWVQPRIALRSDDIPDNDDIVFVEDIAIEDRLDYLGLVVAGDTAAMQILSERQQPDTTTT